MKLASVLAALALLALLPAGASADVQLIDGKTAGAPTFSGAGTLRLVPTDHPDQMWFAAISVREGVTVERVHHGTQDFTRQVQRAEHGTRTEIWTLSNPDTSFGDVRFVVSGATPVRFAAAQLTGAHRTNPILGAASNAGDSVATSATVSLPTPGRAVDYLIGVLTGADATTMTNLSVTPAGGPWGDSGDDGPLRVLGNMYGEDAQSITWSWTAPTPLTENAWTAALLGVRAPDLATLGSVTSSAVTQTSASLSASVTGDGSGTVSRRGFVYCVCPTPTRGGAGVVDLDGGSGTGAFTGSMSGLSRGTSYTVRAYAVNQGGTAYSSPATVTTSPNRPPTATLDGPFEVT